MGNKMQFKPLIQDVLHRFGYHLSRWQVNDLEFYLKIYGEESVREKRFYNVGAAEFYHPAWTNVDKPSTHYRDRQGDRLEISWDMLKKEPLDLPDGKAEIIYSSQTIEHVTDEGVEYFFRESYRILKKRGILRIVVPDIDLAYRAYQRNDRNFFKAYDRYDASIDQLFLSVFASSTSTVHAPDKLRDTTGPTVFTDEQIITSFREMPFEQALDYFMSHCSLEVQDRCPGGHISWWNRKKLMTKIRAAGFEEVYVSGYGQSMAQVLRNTVFFDCSFSGGSLYMEAFK